MPIQHITMHIINTHVCTHSYELRTLLVCSRQLVLLQIVQILTEKNKTQGLYYYYSWCFVIVNDTLLTNMSTPACLAA